MAITDAISQALSGFLGGVFTNEATAAAYASDPHGALAAAGLSEVDLTHEEMQEAVYEAAQSAGVPQETLASLADAPAPAPGAPPLESLVSEVNYATATVYGGDSVIAQDLTAINNETDINIDAEGGHYGGGDIDGDIDIETTNVNATGDAAVAAGRDVDNAATGDAAVVVDGDNYGGIASGDGAVAAGEDISAPVNTGTNTGIIADGDVENAVVGDDNQVVNVDGDVEESAINFGSGDNFNFGDADIDDSAISIGGNATNVSDNEAYDGSAIAAGNAAGANVETDVDIDHSFNEDTYVYADESVVSTEQGVGEQDVNAEDVGNEDFEDLH